MKKNSWILLFVFGASLYFQACMAQKKVTLKPTSLYVPYKIKDKFGIATEDGKIVVTPQFDYIELNYTPEFFTCFTYMDSKSYRTSLVVKDKIVLENQPYFGYYNTRDIVFAVMEVGGRGSGYYSLKPEEIHLYTLKGKRISPEGFSHASTFDELDPKNEIAQVLLYLVHRDKTYSIVQYDLKKQIITSTWIDKARDIEFEDLGMLYRTQELHVKYVDAQNKGKELKIGIKGKSYVKTYEGTYEINKKSDDLFLDGNVAVPNWDSEKQPKPRVEEREVQSKQIRLKKDYQTYRPMKLIIENKKLDPKYQKIVFENGKKGLYDSYENKEVLPTIYDDFFFADFKGIHAGGFVLKQNTSYTFQIYGSSQSKGHFSLFPMITFYAYGRPDFHLVGLFDEQGQFICYANQDGKVYLE